MTEHFFEIRQLGANLYAYLPPERRGWFIAIDENPEVLPVRALGQPIKIVLNGATAYQEAKDKIQGMSIDGITANAYFLLGFGLMDTTIYHKGYKQDITQQDEKICTFLQPYNIPTRRLFMIDKHGDKIIKYPEYDTGIAVLHN